MVLASDLAGRIAWHFRSYGMRDNVRHQKDESVLYVQGFNFNFEVNGKQADIIITPPIEKEDDFLDYFFNREEYLKDPKYSLIKSKQNEHRKHILNPQYDKNSDKKYHFRCEFASNNPEKATYGILAYAISPFLMFLRKK